MFTQTPYEVQYILYCTFSSALISTNKNIFLAAKCSTVYQLAANFVGLLFGAGQVANVRFLEHFDSNENKNKWN